MEVVVLATSAGVVVRGLGGSSCSHTCSTWYTVRSRACPVDVQGHREEFVNPGSQPSVVVHVSKVNLTNSNPFGVVVVLGVFGPTGLVLATIVELEVIGSWVFGDGSRSRHRASRYLATTGVFDDPTRQHGPGQS